MRDWLLVAWVLLTSGLLSATMGANILAVFPFPSRSHVIMYSQLMKGLASRGHHVTVFSGYPLDKPVANYTDVKLTLDQTAFLSATGNKSIFSIGEMNSFVSIVISQFIGGMFAEQTFQHKEIQDLISSTDKKFDLVFISDFSNEAFAGFAHKFDAPIIYISPITGFPWTNDYIGNPSPDSYVSSIFSKYTDQMTFIERMINTVLNNFGRVFHQLYHIPKQDKLMREYFKHIEDLPHLSEINRRIALVFTYAMPGVNYPQPLLPNMIQIGGIHLKPSKPLPKDLKDFMDSATEGVIYFSMGSNLRSAEFPEHKRNAFIRTFSKLKQKVLWKFEDENLPGQPDNLKISKWFPQNDILAHPNVILFITHGGILSTQETVHHGVPIIGIPIFGDQVYNMKVLEKLGCGLQLKYSDINDESVETTVKEAISNPSYRKRAKEVSRIFHDQPQSAMARGVFWTEYVLRHKGAYHLRSAAIDLSWYQYFLLDVIAVLVLVPVTLAYCFVLLCKRIFCAKKKLAVSESKKKK